MARLRGAARRPPWAVARAVAVALAALCAGGAAASASASASSGGGPYLFDMGKPLFGSADHTVKTFMVHPEFIRAQLMPVKALRGDGIWVELQAESARFGETAIEEEGGAADAAPGEAKSGAGEAPADSDSALGGSEEEGGEEEPPPDPAHVAAVAAIAKEHAEGPTGPWQPTPDGTGFMLAGFIVQPAPSLSAEEIQWPGAQLTPPAVLEAVALSLQAWLEARGGEAALSDAVPDGVGVIEIPEGEVEGGEEVTGSGGPGQGGPGADGQGREGNGEGNGDGNGDGWGSEDFDDPAQFNPRDSAAEVSLQPGKQLPECTTTRLDGTSVLLSELVRELGEGGAGGLARPVVLYTGSLS